jgi:hypothetical protein
MPSGRSHAQYNVSMQVSMWLDCAPYCFKNKDLHVKKLPRGFVAKSCHRNHDEQREERNYTSPRSTHLDDFTEAISSPQLECRFYR